MIVAVEVAWRSSAWLSGDRRCRGCGARAGRGRRLGGGGRHARRRPGGLGALRRPSPRKRLTRVGVPGRLAGGRGMLLGDSACRRRNDESRDDQGDRGDSGEGCTTPTRHRLPVFSPTHHSSRCSRRGDVNGALDPGCVRSSRRPRRSGRECWCTIPALGVAGMSGVLQPRAVVPAVRPASAGRRALEQGRGAASPSVLGEARLGPRRPGASGGAVGLRRRGRGRRKPSNRLCCLDGTRERAH